jgi:hypothetical protein
VNVKILTSNEDLIEWTTNNLGWTISNANNDALVVADGWQSRWPDTQEVIIAKWAGKPTYKVNRTNDGFRLEHVIMTDEQLAYMYTAHAKGYRVKMA